jgi:uncharacterized protein
VRFNFLDLLLPRETKFFDLFTEHAARLVAGAKRLRELSAELGRPAEAPAESASPPDRRDILKAGVAAVKEMEREADKIEKKVNEALEQSFITPFDREDIHLIASAVDNAIDAVKALTTKLDIYGVLELPPRFGEFAEVIMECSTGLAEAFERMKKRSSLSAHAKAVSEAEKKADLLFSIVIGDLFKSEKTAVEIIREKEVYEGLEEIVNRINTTAKFLRRVMIKQG